MNNIIPKIIHDKYLAGVHKGHLKATSLFMDLSGFTNMTEILMKEGKEGAEIVSSILNSVFTPLIDIVYKYGGFVTGFLGDAFTAIFPKSVNPIMVIICADEIINLAKSNGLQKTRFGTFDLSAKVGIGIGSIQWGVVGNDNHRSYYFKGNAIKRCTGSEKCCSKLEIVVDKNVLPNLPEGSIDCEPISENHFRLIKILYKTHLPVEPKTEFLSTEVLSHFFPDKIIHATGSAGELREIVSTFISFRNITTHKQIDEMVKVVFEDLDNLGGYIKGVEFGDKGGTILVVFGAPVSYEDNIKRALSFILSIKSKFKNKIRAGITHGTVYAGIVGGPKRYSYDVLGDIVNISSRMMMKADWGSVWISESVEKKCKDEFNFDFVNTFKLKGRNQTVNVFKLVGKINTQFQNIYHGKMIGRHKETSLLKNNIEAIFTKKFGGVVFVYGEAGSGKSRFTSSVIEEYIDTTTIVVLQCDGILKKSLNPIIYFLNVFFNQNEQLDNKKQELAFTKKFETLLIQLRSISNTIKTEIIEELIRTESFLKALLGLNTTGTLYESVDPKLKSENTINAVKNLFKGLSLIQPLIIKIEDIHLIDEDSNKALEIITRNVSNFPFIIIATSRYNDDDSKPNLMLSENILTSEIELKELDRNSVKVIAESWFKNKTDKKLLDFIVQRTNSNPFYVEQFCLYLIENNFIEVKDDICCLKVAAVGIPHGVNSILIARIDRLSPNLKELMYVASVLGREFDITVLSRMLNSITELIEKYSLLENNYFISLMSCKILKKENVKALLKSGSKFSLWQKKSELKYIFQHSLLVQTAYQMQLRDRLKKLHRIAADIINSLYKDEPVYYADIAYHYEKGDVKDKTQKYLQKAADHFKSLYQNEEALIYYDKLISFTDNKEARIEIILKKVDVLELIGKWDEAIVLLKETITHMPNVKKIYLAKLKNALGKIFLAKTRYDDALALFEEAGKIAETKKDIKLQLSVLGNIGDIYSNKGNYEEAMKRFTEQKTMYLKLNDSKNYADTMLKIGVIYHDKGDYENAIKYYDDSKKICEKINYKKGYSEAIGNTGVLYIDKGDYNNAAICFSEDKKICEELGDKNGYAIAVGNMGLVYYGMCNYDEALKSFSMQKNIAEELGDKKNYAITVGNMGGAYRNKGDYKNAMKCFEEQKNIAMALENKTSHARAINQIGRLYAAKGDYENAMHHYNESKKLCKNIDDPAVHASTIRNIAEVYAETGDYNNAIINYNDVIEIAHKMESDYYLCNYLNGKADILFNFGKIIEAKKINDEAFILSNKAGDSNDVFKATLLKAKIQAQLESKKDAIQTLLNMIDTYKDDNHILAEIHYSIWSIIKDTDHKSMAIKLYTKMYKKTPNCEYKKRLDKMNCEK